MPEGSEPRLALPDQTVTDDISRAPVAQLDRVSGYEPEGREFESLRARQLNQSLMCGHRVHTLVLSTTESPVNSVKPGRQ